MTLFRLFILSFCITIFPIVTPLNSSDNFELVKKGITEYFHSGSPPIYLEEAFKNYQLTGLFKDGMEYVFDNGQICYLCNLLVDLVIGERKLGLSRETLAKEASYICVHSGIYSRRVCDGVIDLNLDTFLYILDNHPNFTSNRICGSIFQPFGCPKGEDFDWSINIASGNSADRPKPNDTTNKFNILQLTDIHFDPEYKPYGKADCNEPICCQSDQGEPSSNETACGYWTDYRNADAPWHLVEETIRQAKTQEFDYVYYTGDIISHRVWETSIEKNTKSINQLYTYFKENFNVPVYPIFGNHEPHPLDLWPSESVNGTEFSVQWLFELAAKSWSELIGEDVGETVSKGGYYTVSPRPGFRIIAINSNFCYSYNWWLLFDDFDPYGQLQWLADTLKQAEDNNESVHILSHIPSGTTSSLSVWGREYSRIIERFSNTITGQFNGHTHRDQFAVFYNTSNPTQAVGVAFNGASVTPYDLANPNFKIYQVEAESFSLLDYEVWSFNLTLANSKPSTATPEWFKLYSFVEAYGVDNLSPVEVDKVLYKMVQNHSLLEDYFRFYFRNGDAGIKPGCDDDCKKKYLCEIVTTVYGDDTQCNRFLELYDQ